VPAREAALVRTVGGVASAAEATGHAERGLAEPVRSTPMTPTVGVLALQGDVVEHLRAVESAGGTAIPVRRPGELEAVHGLIIPGGESTTIWKLARTFDLAGPLRERIARGMPVFGSCAGMVMLAARLVDQASEQETLAAIDMTVRRNAFGRQRESFESDIEISGVAGGSAGPPFRAVFIRAPWVEDIGPDVEALATEPRTGRIVAVRQGPALATAFHPELTDDSRLHAIFIDMLRDNG
jgi:5'-phosphate synthase pdxT subunit